MSSSEGDAGAGGMVNLLLVLEPDPELDPEASERLTRQLRTELAELDIESVRAAPTGTAPHGAKGTNPVMRLDSCEPR